MARKRSQYVLASKEETDRLEKQAQMKAYDFKEELAFLDIRPGEEILDAGCGSGIVSNYLSGRARDVRVLGIDASADRIEEAWARYGGNVSFSRQDLLELDSMNGRFDTVVCRYVLRHFSPSDGKKVLRKLFDVLKPGGTLCCIDVEGVLGPVHPASSFLSSALRKLREAKAVDFQVARKIPSLLVEHGFEGIDWHALISEFKGGELSREIENLEKAVAYAEPFAKQVLGGAPQLARFKREYFAALRENPGLALFYTRVIATGSKPKLRLVR